MFDCITYHVILFVFFMLELGSKLCLFKRLHNMTSIKAFFAFVSLNRYSTHTKQPQHSCVHVCLWQILA